MLAIRNHAASGTASGVTSVTQPGLKFPLANTAGARNYWKSHDFRELGNGLIDAFVDAAGRIPDPQTEIAFAQLGGAVGRVPADATANTHRGAQFAVNIHGRWADPAKDAECTRWVRDLFTAATPFATGGVYVNFLTQEEGDRVQAAYGSNYARRSHARLELRNVLAAANAGLMGERST